MVNRSLFSLIQSPVLSSQDFIFSIVSHVSLPHSVKLLYPGKPVDNHKQNMIITIKTLNSIYSSTEYNVSMSWTALGWSGFHFIHFIQSTGVEKEIRKFVAISIAEPTSSRNQYEKFRTSGFEKYSDKTLRSQRNIVATHSRTFAPTRRRCRLGFRFQGVNND